MDPETELNAHILMAQNWEERTEGGGFIWEEKKGMLNLRSRLYFLKKKEINID